MVKVLSSRPLGETFYFWWFDVSALATWIVRSISIILLLWTVACFITTATGRTSKVVFNGKAHTADDQWRRPKKWDCTDGGIVRPKSRAKGIDEGIDEALRMLRNCESCRALFNREDPIKLLKRLDEMGAIFESNQAPMWVNKPGFRSWVGSIGKITYEFAWAITIDVSGERPKLTYPMIKPCIYVNPAGGLVREPQGYTKEDLARERGLLIIHELAHAAGMIPHDGKDPKEGITAEISLKLSIKNQQCIKNHCSPCLSGAWKTLCYDKSLTKPPSRRRRKSRSPTHKAIHPPKSQPQSLRSGTLNYGPGSLYIYVIKTVRKYTGAPKEASNTWREPVEVTMFRRMKTAERFSSATDEDAMYSPRIKS
jgi:hypothetical protein